MKAVVVKSFGNSSVLQIVKDFALPKLTDTSVLVKVKCSGVNPVDTYIRSGVYTMLPSLPYVPGMEGSGVVADCGKKVTKFKKGDRVFFCKPSTGSYAEYCLCKEDNLFSLREELSFKEGASIGISYFTAYRALIAKGNARKGQTLLVHGASGGVGLACIQLGKHLGMQVLGTAGTDQGIELVQKTGAHKVFNHNHEDYLVQIKKSNLKIDMIVEMLANKNLSFDLDLIADNGIVLVVGSRGPIEINPRLLMTQESKVAGVQFFKTTESEWKDMAIFMTEFLKKEKIKPVVGSEFPIAEAPKTHDEVIGHPHGSHGKVVLKID